MKGMNVKPLIGKQVVAIQRNGTAVKGKLVKIQGQKLYLQPTDHKVRTKALLPLLLFDVAAVGEASLFYGGEFGYPFGFPAGFGYRPYFF